MPKMPRVSPVTALTDYRLAIAFDDGTSGVIAIGDRLFGKMFEPLKDVALFNEAKIDEFGAVCWPNGADLAPDDVYERLRRVVG